MKKIYDIAKIFYFIFLRKIARRGYRKKMNLLKISQFPDFIQCFPDFSQRFSDFSQRFPDFSITKYFKARKCERCGSLNPRLTAIQNNGAERGNKYIDNFPYLFSLWWPSIKRTCILLFHQTAPKCLCVDLHQAMEQEVAFRKKAMSHNDPIQFPANIMGHKKQNNYS